MATNSLTVTPTTTLLPGARLYIEGVGELIVHNDYDDLGQLQAKKVGGTPGSDYDSAQDLQTVDYTYNVRGWLTGINNDNIVNTNELITLGSEDLFGFQINYSAPHNFGGNETPTNLYNGNIAQVLWKTTSTNSPPYNDVSERYTYGYDALNRITTALDNTGHYGLDVIGYDKNGNIGGLERQGHRVDNPDQSVTGNFGTMDDLSYYYNGNQLHSVTDAITGISVKGEFKDGNISDTDFNTTGDNDYVYDDNGNMTSDANKGITGITYNHLNLPTNVVVNGNGNNGNIQYIYDAMGVRLKKITTDTGQSSVTTTDYAGNYVYENDKLQFFSTAEGYVEPKDPNNLSLGYDYIYQYTDHLGNIRLSYKNVGTSTVDLEIQEENNYYPFGLKHKGYNSVVNGTENNYQTYNGKELEKSLGLNLLEYGARSYDPALGRWTSIDPLADKYYKFSPYVYVGNSPTIAVDPDGKRILFVNGYWNSWIGGIIGSSSPGKNYWGRGFTGAAQNFFGDYSSVSDSNYIDASSYFGGDSSGGGREQSGYDYAKENYSTLIDGLAEDETFKLVTHSEGGAYGAGISRYLIERGHTVESILHLSTDEGDEFDTPEEPDTYQLSLGGDWVTGNKEISSGVDIFGVVDQFESKSDKAQFAHGSTKSASVFKSAKALLRAVLKGATGVNVTETKSGIKFEIIRDNNKQEDEQN